MFELLIFIVAVAAGSVAAVVGFGIGSLLTPLFGVVLDTKLAVAAVSGLLDGAEVEALARRVDQIRRHPVHPPPPDDRPPLPWPIW